MDTKTGVAWLTVRVSAPNARRLNTKLVAVVKRAHGAGLTAATITQAPTDLPAPAGRHAEIRLPDGVSGTVTIAADPRKLTDFVRQVSDLLGPDAIVELDGAIIELQAVGS